MCVYVCVHVADEGRGRPILHRLPHHKELLRGASRLHKNQELYRHSGRDRAGRAVHFRDAGAEGGQVRRCRPVGRQEYGNRSQRCHQVPLDSLPDPRAIQAR